MRLLSILAMLVVAAFITITFVLYGTTRELAASQTKLALTATDLRHTKEQLERTTESRDKALEQNETHIATIQGKQTVINESDGLNYSLTRDIRSLVSANNELEAQYTELEKRNETAKEEISTLASDNNDLRMDVRAATETVRELRSAREEQALVLEDFLLANEDLKRTNDTLRIEKERAESANAMLTDELSVAEVELTEARQEIRRLESSAGTIDRLQGQIAELRSEIADLEQKRRPLVLGTYRATFSCTGSMEPKITCLDSATMLENFRPADITVGTTISFVPTAACRTKSESILHRVIKVKVEGGVYHYWPKGDASREADGCWIPEHNVNGYLVELHKNTEPDNATLRKTVNAAIAAADRAWSRYAEKFELYCGFPPNSGSKCFLPGHQVDEIERLITIYHEAADHEECWVDSAASAFRTYGGQVLYLVCFMP